MYTNKKLNHFTYIKQIPRSNNNCIGPTDLVKVMIKTNYTSEQSVFAISTEKQEFTGMPLTCCTKFVCITTSKQNKATATPKYTYSNASLIRGVRSCDSIPERRACTRRKVCSGSIDCSLSLSLLEIFKAFVLDFIRPDN